MLPRVLQDAQTAEAGAPPGYAFYFTRGIYTGVRRGRWGGSWATDYPKADRQFLVGLKHLTGIDAYGLENPVPLDDAALRHYPLVYVLEVGYMAISDTEVTALRDFLRAGGMLMVDDFWGTYEWANFEREIRRVLPNCDIVELPLDHPLFHTVYDISRVRQVPNINNAMRGGPYWERDGYVPHLRGIFDDEGRLIVVINWNTDLGDAWEWAENPYYPIELSNYAWQVAVNTIVYAMTH